MQEQKDQKGASWWAWTKQYVIGLGAGVVCAAYGLIALIVGKTFLPGLSGDDHMLHNRTGAALAAAYLVGGLFLILRLHLERKAQAPRTRENLYLLENVLLVGFIGTVVYVLFHMGTAH